MPINGVHRANRRAGGASLLSRLRGDASGNTLAIVAAAMAPLLAIIGSGIDLGRGYLSETRLQQACDAGVLAARKKLGASVAPPGTPPPGVVTSGNQFFNLNFRTGSYGSANRSFVMTLQPDLSVNGVATVEVPTTVMNLFGYAKVDVAVECTAKLNYTNTDIMMVLDTTGSMNQTNPGDTVSKITALKDVVTSFHAQLEAGKGPGTRVRYGFVPYSVNVNVGALLQDNWVVGSWFYQSREDDHSDTSLEDYTYTDNWVTVSGNSTDVNVHSYPATFHAAATEYDSDWYSCDQSASALGYNSTYTDTDTLISTSVDTAWAGPPPGTKTTEHRDLVENGSWYYEDRSGTTCYIVKRTYNALHQTYDRITIPSNQSTYYYRYARLPKNVANWRSESNGCVEERDTYEITDYNNVDFTRALDLDIDTVPIAGNSATQWRPQYPDIIYERSLDWYGDGSFTVAPVVTTDAYFFMPSNVGGLVSCPAPARKLAEMSASDISSFLSTLDPSGYTYHDIGMIWGGRLISPTGLFAAENADVSGKPTSRHLIFLTDGQTNTMDIAYGPYGVEPLDQRRWTSTSALSLDQTVENRFGVACSEIKKRNVTVWVISFGTSVSNMMKQCAGTGKWFKADDTSQLNTAFQKIAASMGDLRIAK